MEVDNEIFRIITDRTNDNWLDTVSVESANIIKNKLGEIPTEFFEPRISLDFTEENKISLIEFSMQTAGMSKEKRDGLMSRYRINPYDLSKLQSIIDSIKVAREYGIAQETKRGYGSPDKHPYGIALSNEQSLDKAYPLWLAYLYADSKNPMEDISCRLKEDGMDEKYDAEYIVSLMEHTNSLLNGKSMDEKKEFYMQTINGILEEKGEIIQKKAEVEI